MVEAATVVVSSSPSRLTAFAFVGRLLYCSFAYRSLTLAFPPTAIVWCGQSTCICSVEGLSVVGATTAVGYFFPTANEFIQFCWMAPPLLCNWWETYFGIPALSHLMMRHLYLHYQCRGPWGGVCSDGLFILPAVIEFIWKIRMACPHFIYLHETFVCFRVHLHLMTRPLHVHVLCRGPWGSECSNGLSILPTAFFLCQYCCVVIVRSIGCGGSPVTFLGACAAGAPVCVVLTTITVDAVRLFFWMGATTVGGCSAPPQKWWWSIFGGSIPTFGILNPTSDPRTLCWLRPWCLSFAMPKACEFLRSIVKKGEQPWWHLGI